jgi:hypothetical protein
LFLGYSCNDPDLNLFLDRFKDSFPRGATQHYALLSNLDDVGRRRLLDYGIFPIEYTPSTTAHPEVAQFIEELLTAYDPKKAEVWSDERAKQPKAMLLSSVTELRELPLGARRDRMDQEFSMLFGQIGTSYELSGAHDLPPMIKQRRAETLEFLAGAWQVDTVPPLNALDGREIVGELGRGGFGVVWLVEDVRTRERQALKVAHFQETTNYKFVQRFKQGIKAMRRLTNHGVGKSTKYLGHREVPLCVFMEYVDGGDLGALIKDVPLDSATRLRLGRDVVSIVAEAHKVPVYHRDLKPSNVLVRWDASGTPQVVLSDFDLAWFEGAITRTTTRIGDQAFAPPEQLREGRKSSNPARAEADVYSLGMLLLFIVSRTMPSTGQWYNRNLREESLRLAMRELTWLRGAERFAALVVQCAIEAPFDRPSATHLQTELQILFEAENSGCSEPEMFVEETRLRVAQLHAGAPFEPLHGIHIEQRRDSGRVVLQASFARQVRDSDDRGRFKPQADKDVQATRACLQRLGWGIQSWTTTAIEARVVANIELNVFSLDVAKRRADDLAQGLEVWSKRG